MDDAILSSKDLPLRSDRSQEEQDPRAAFAPPKLPPPLPTRRVDRYVLPHASRGNSVCAFDVEGEAVVVGLFDGVFPFEGVEEIKKDRVRAILLGAGFVDESYDVPAGDVEDAEFVSVESAPTGAELGGEPTGGELDQGDGSGGNPAGGGTGETGAPSGAAAQTSTESVPTGAELGDTGLQLDPGAGSTPPPPPPGETQDPPAMEYVLRHPDFDPQRPHEGEYRVTVMREGDVEEEIVLKFGLDSTILTEDAAVAAVLREQGFDLIGERPKEGDEP